jgi:hypothetical protein
MAGVTLAISRGTAAPAEKPKPDNRPFHNAGSPTNKERLQKGNRELTSLAEEHGITEKIDHIREAFKRSGNEFPVNFTERLIEAIKAGVFNRSDIDEIMNAIIAKCPDGADSVAKVLTSLLNDLGNRFYEMSAKAIVDTVVPSMKRSASQCPKEIHNKILELVSSGELDHISQMQQLRIEIMATEQTTARAEFTGSGIAMQTFVSHADARPAQAIAEYPASAVEKLPARTMVPATEFKTPQLIRHESRLRSITPLIETASIQKDAVQRVQRTIRQPGALREQALRNREESRAPARQPPEPQVKPAKAGVLGPEFRQHTPKEPAWDPQKAAPASTSAQKQMGAAMPSAVRQTKTDKSATNERKAKRQMPQGALTNEIRNTKRIRTNLQGHVRNRKQRYPRLRRGIAASQIAAKPARFKKISKKKLLIKNGIRKLARTAKSRITGKIIEAKKRREMKSAIAKPIQKKNEKSAPAKALTKKKAKIAPSFPAEKKGVGPLGAGTLKRSRSFAHRLAAARVLSRTPRGKGRTGFLKFLIAPGFFSSRRQRKGLAIRARNHF